MKKILSSILVLTAITFSAMAQKPAVMLDDKAGWHKIGETIVNFATDKDNIVVIGADRFKAIKFKVNNEAIDLQDLEVYYEKEKDSDASKSENSANSEMNKDDIQVRTPINAGEESKVIELKNGPREIKRVVFTYRTLPNSKGQKAVVELWGLK